MKLTVKFLFCLLLTCFCFEADAQNTLKRPVAPKPTISKPEQQKQTPAKPVQTKPKRKAAPKPQGWRNESYYEAPAVVNYPSVEHEQVQSQRRQTPNNMCVTADDYFYGDGDVAQDYEMAAYWYYRAADEGHAIAQNNLGLCYEKGYGVEKDLESAAYWYWQSAQQGNAIAQCNVGNCYRFGWGVEVDEQAAKEWYQLAAGNGDPEAKRLLHLLYQ